LQNLRLGKITNREHHLQQDKTFNAFRNLAVPLLAIVPRESTSSCFVMPIPESLKIKSKCRPE
jgi:hypothetical protein